MADTRHADLLAELEKRAWLSGEWHQRHDHHGNVSLIFGSPGKTQIAVAVVPDQAPRTNVRMMKVKDPRTGRTSLNKVTSERPFIKGEGYTLRFAVPDHPHETASTGSPKEAVDLMERWRRQGVAEALPAPAPSPRPRAAPARH